MTPTLAINDLHFEVRRSARRQTVEITVDRDGELIISAPEGCGRDFIARFVRDKKFWIYTKLAEKDARRQPVAPKEFVNGEGFPYLGRSHRLLLVDRQRQPIELKGGRFRLLRSDVPGARKHLIRWYTRRAEEWISRRIDRLAARVGVETPAVNVRDLGFRWGSCGRGKLINVHWATILLPSGIVEYVVVHELVHLIEKHHTVGFWRLLEQAMPDFQQRKTWLADHGMRLTTI